MKRLLMLSSILLLSAVWAVAQYGSQDTSNQGSSQSSATSSASGNMTVQGCLSGSDGNYTLTDKTGTAFNLTGNTSRLQAHVGHTISVTGMASSGSASGQTGSMSSPSDSSHQNLMVSSFKHVSPTCNMASQ